MTRDCDRDDVDELLAKLEDTEDWSVEDWEFSVSKSEAGAVELTVAWNPPLPRQTMQAVKDSISRLDNGDGVSEAEIRESLGDHDEVGHAIEELRQMGEIYESHRDHYRVV